MNARAACAAVVAAVLRGEASLNTLLPRYAAQIADRDHSLLRELSFGTLRHYPALQAILEQLLEKPLKTKDAEVKAALVTALYQIRELRTPDHAAVHEAVAILKALGKPWAKGLVNAVLRRYLRERDAIEARCARDSRYVHLHPRWLEQMLRSAWPNEADAIMTANNQRPPLCVRVNRLRGSREAYLALLAEQDIDASAAKLSPDGIYLTQPRDVSELPGFSEGLVSVQDEAAQLCAPLLACEAGHRVLDACCAPGGKTGHLLEIAPQIADLLALDVDAQRLTRVADNLSRLGLDARVQVADAAQIASWWDGQHFDRILLDAPCSATGVIRRHPDIKLLRQPGDIATLAATQLELLAALWQTLKPGGRLLYATCSVLPQENDQVISRFVAMTADCRALTITVPWGQKTAYGRQLLPTIAGSDGFYYALLSKTPQPRSERKA